MSLQRLRQFQVKFDRNTFNLISNIQHSVCVRIPFLFIAYTHDNLCRKIITFQSFGKGYRIIRRAEFLEEIR